MFWYIIKITENDKTIVYSYGFESREQTGEAVYYKSSQTAEVTKLAENDSDVIIKDFFIPHLCYIIQKENAPEKRFIAIG
ncbi:MAG: hypothetical protein J5562_08415 [Clostridia bacterium]|nr:hypothetical protein [Clostridia bacterium]